MVLIKPEFLMMDVLALIQSDKSPMRIGFVNFSFIQKITSTCCSICLPFYFFGGVVEQGLSYKLR